MSHFKVSGLLMSTLLLLLLVACKENTNQEPISEATKPSTLPAKNGRSASGYLYEHYIRNEGLKPMIGDRVEYHELLFKNDSLVKSTFLQLAPIKAVMPPREKVATPPPPSYDALFLMSVGDSLMTYQTLDTFRNYKRPGWLEADDTLFYHLKLLSIQPKADIEAEKAALEARKEEVVQSTKSLLLDYRNGKLDGQVKSLESGLKYIIHEPGTGAQVEKGKFVKVNYAGFLTNGNLFDNSFQKGRPFPYQVGRGRIIKGWGEALPLLKEGGKGTFFIPYQLAYGEAGNPPSIPPKSELVFYIEVVESIN